MKEFMFYIRNARDAKKSLTKEEHRTFIKKCEVYISLLKGRNQLIAAQPLVRDGVVIKRAGNKWYETNIVSGAEVQVGYYHILANNLEEAVKIAKDNPEFEYMPSASIEVRPVKTIEVETGFMYPHGV